MDLSASGDNALDTILGGGFPVRSVNVVAGAPGSGKTLFTLQMLFALARRGQKCLYFTTLSEPALKLVRYIQGFSFFDAALLESRIRFLDLSTTLRAKGVEDAVAELTAHVEEEEPAFVVIDSFKALGELIPNPVLHRTLVHDLAVQMAAWGSTTFLVGEYTEGDITAFPEFAIADGIVVLENRHADLTAVRGLEIRKLRGMNYITGRHFFDITPQGLAFHPRVRAPDRLGEADLSDRVPFGISGLDELVDGGAPRGSTTVVQGGTGTGKTLLGLQFLVEGARRGERGVLVSLEETSSELRAIAGGFGFDLRALEESKLLVMRYESPVELSTDRFLNMIREEVAATGAKRVVLDSLTSMALGVPSERRLKELVYATTKHLRALGATVVMTMEIPDLLGSALITGHGISFAADNLIQLRYVEAGGRLSRALIVIKVRGVKHSTELRALDIGSSGMCISEPFTDQRGVLSGIVPAHAKAQTSEGSGAK